MNNKSIKRYFLFLTFIIVGGIIGGIIVNVYWIRFMTTYTELSEMEDVANLEELTFKIYSTGNYNNSIIALHDLSDRLEIYVKTLHHTNPNYAIFINDLVLTHGRLFLVYQRNGEQNLAEQEYQKAMKLIDKRWDIKSEKQLKDMIETIDRNAWKKMNIKKGLPKQ